LVVFGGIPRIASRDVTYGGVTLPAGSDVRVLFAAANRDPAVFADPDRFDPARDNSAALSFSQGIHFCPGAVLSRTEMAIALTRIHARFPHLSAAGDPTPNANIRMRAVDRLPVTESAATAGRHPDACRRGSSRPNSPCRSR